MNQNREIYDHELFATLKGKTLVAIKRVDTSDQGSIGIDGGDELWLACSDGTRYRMWHSQDCCEDVRITDMGGDIELLLGSPLTIAEVAESTRTDDGETEGNAIVPLEDEYTGESSTWTFYKLSSAKESVTIRWHGSSNGYYSESVSFARLSDWSGDAQKALESTQLRH